ncbi:MAG: hypothetical protein HY963_07950 [Ignavibacteriales bacterium]|nr:hypothetical protein [Ignavibacteriales bacterium]
MIVKQPTGKMKMFSDRNDAIDYLLKLKTEIIQVEPEQLHVINNGKTLFLEIFDNGIKQLPMRETFLYKLLRWHSFPTYQLKILDIETVTSLLNDYLLGMKNRYVNIKCEQGEALTITSSKFTEVEDLEILRRLDDKNVESVFINDYDTFINTETLVTIEPFPNKVFGKDVFGVGLSIVNSETGFRTFQINNYLLRYVCSNRAYVKFQGDEVCLSHYNLFLQDAYQLLDYKLRERLNYAEVINKKLSEMDRPISSEFIYKVNREIMKKLGVKILSDLLESDRQITKYDLFNLITERAKDYSMSKRILLEEIAGKLLN